MFALPSNFGEAQLSIFKTALNDLVKGRFSMRILAIV